MALRTLIVVGLVVAVVLVVVLRMKPASPRTEPPPRLAGLGNLVFWTVLLAGLGLALTGFYQPLFAGEPVGGFPLLAHVSFGGAFLVLLPVLALLRGERHASSPDVPLRVKIAFWVFLLMGLVTGVTILFSMFPLFDAHGLHLMLKTHFFAGLIATVALTVLVAQR
jgi:hypothetical protein